MPVRGSQTTHQKQRDQSGNTPIRDARDAAYRHLSALSSRFPDLLPSEVNTGSLEARDASLAIAIVDASLRRWRTLEFILESVSGHKSYEIEPRLRAVLLGGTAQLLLLDRVPPHAVLDESVAWAKRFIRPGVGGMVNAILRKVTRVRGGHAEENWSHHLDAIPLSEGGMLRLNGVELPEHGRRRLGIACSLPNALLERWESHFEDPTPQALHTIYKPPTIIYTHHHRTELNQDLISSHRSQDHRVFGGTRHELVIMLESHPEIWVQDPASSATLANQNFEDAPARVIDLCAGQGTKTRQLRAMFPECEIIACEVDPKRLHTLRELFEHDPRVQVKHVEEIGAAMAGTADLVLADVPCSNTGVLPRRIEARYRPIQAQLKRLVRTQQEILMHAYALLSAGGDLIYSTCSAEVEENEANADWASRELKMELVELQRVDATGQPGDPPSEYQDGSFAARLRRIN